MSKTHNDLKFGKETKMLIVVDTSLLPLKPRALLGLRFFRDSFIYFETLRARTHVRALTNQLL